MKKLLIFLAIGTVAALVTFSVYRQSLPFFQHLDLKLKDTRFLLRGPVKPSSKVAIVAIDNKSIKEIGRWPWSREIIANLLTGLKSYGATVTALDIVFSEAQDRSSDEELARGIKKAGNVVMGYFFRDEEQTTDPLASEQVAAAKIKLLKIDEGVAAVPLNEYKSMDPNIPLLGKNALDLGFFNQLADSDGVFRKSPLLLLYRGDVYPSLSLKALQHYVGSDIVVDVAPFGVRSVNLGQFSLPVNEHGELTLNYYGPTESFPTFSAVDIIKHRLPDGALKDRLVFVGATEMGIYDVRNTPFDPALPGVEIHATISANTLENRFLIRDGRTIALEIAAILILPVLLALLLALVPGTLVGLVFFFLLGGLFLALNFFLFSRHLMDLSIFYPIISLSLSQLGSEAYRNLVVERKGRQLRKAFSSYVSPDLVRQIEKNPDKLVLGGEQREISILFSDIRGFTTLSEGLTPPDLVRLLNEYLSPMTRIVLDERGTLDKFIGDAVMAIFNAPLDVSGHATRACAAAVRMLEQLKELNEDFSARELHTIDIGVGINTGPAIVGNMGADIRFDYTAIGDSVNLASRLEGLNKYYGSHILVSDDTRRQVDDERFTFREVDRVRVKGKNVPIVMYELMIANRELLPEFEEGLEKYRNRDFAGARNIFLDLEERFGDGPSRLYATRCAEYLETPPPDDWDGVFSARTK